MAHQHFRTKAIFLKKENLGEADQVFTLFTKDFGKIKVLGRAIRKIKSKLRSGAELFYYSEIEFIQGKTYKTLTDVVLINKFSELLASPEKIETILKIVNIADSLVVKSQKDDRIWRLLVATLKSLQRRRSDLRQFGGGLTSFAFFFWNLCDLLGYKPELYNCAVCRNKLLPEKLFFSAERGGVVCQPCVRKLENNEAVQEISVNTIKALRILLEYPIEILEKLKIENRDQKNLSEISEFYLTYLLA